MCSVVVLSSRAVCVVCSDGAVLYVPVLGLYTQGPRTVCVMKVVCVCLTVSMIVRTYVHEICRFGSMHVLSNTTLLSPLLSSPLHLYLSVLLFLQSFSL